MPKINTIYLIVFIILLGLVQATSFDYIKLNGIKPDILLVSTIFIALSFSRQDTIKAAVTAGLIKDTVSSAVLGSYVFSFIVVGVLINLNQNKFYRQRVSAQTGLSFLSYLFAGVSISFINMVAYRRVDLFYTNLGPIIQGAFYTAVIAPFVFFICFKIFRVNTDYML
jgi:rod shape-determining protein MreD